ncbi:hypothetical protein [Bradyrhizobium jicamae]|uniref:hypothetical protein n=1 Tax=Bradyrhizobium jicamae TaxID=280332 RepID=UPI00390C7181
MHREPARPPVECQGPVVHQEPAAPRERVWPAMSRGELPEPHSGLVSAGRETGPPRAAAQPDAPVRPPAE